MGNIAGYLRGRWRAARRERDLLLLAQMDAKIDMHEAETVKLIGVVEAQIGACKQRMHIELYRHVREKRAVALSEKIMYRMFVRRLKTLEGRRLAHYDVMNNFTGMRDLVDANRNSSEMVSVAMAELAATLDALKSNPVERARDSHARDQHTSKIITKQRMAQAMVETGGGATAIREAFEEEHGSIEERSENEALEQEALGGDGVDALFERASLSDLAPSDDDSILEVSLSSLPTAPSRPLQSPRSGMRCKTKAGYAQMAIEDENENALSM